MTTRPQRTWRCTGTHAFCPQGPCPYCEDAPEDTRDPDAEYERRRDDPPEPFYEHEP